MKAAKPELLIALLIAKAQAMVINTSHEMNFVYFLGLNIPVQAIITQHGLHAHNIARVATFFYVVIFQGSVGQ